MQRAPSATSEETAGTGGQPIRPRTLMRFAASACLHPKKKCRLRQPKAAFCPSGDFTCVGASPACDGHTGNFIAMHQLWTELRTELRHHQQASTAYCLPWSCSWRFLTSVESSSVSVLSDDPAQTALLQPSFPLLTSTEGRAPPLEFVFLFECWRPSW